MNYRKLWFDVRNSITIYESPPPLLLLSGEDVVKVYYLLKDLFGSDMLLESVTYEFRTATHKGVATTDVIYNEDKFFSKHASGVKLITVLFLMSKDISTGEINSRGELIVPESVAKVILDWSFREKNEIELYSF